MKAKEVIQLYEDEEKLSSDEIAKLINNYFIKKCKSIGMKLEFGLSESSLLCASLTIASHVSFSTSQYQKYFKQYLKKVSGVLKKNNINVNSRRRPEQLDIYLPHATSSLWINNDIFYLYVGVYYHNLVVQIRKSPTLFGVERSHELSDYEEFSSELKLVEVYRLIDIMVKTIRLTPFEPR